MNYLAHAYLSRRNPQLIVGGLLGDFVKGKIPAELPVRIQIGIQVHRELDSTTDRHEAVVRSRNRFPAKYRRYSGILIDLFYDHYLANKWHQFHPLALPEFTREVYAAVNLHWHLLPSRLQQILPRMREQDWLASYARTENIQRAARGIASRLSRQTPLAEGAEQLLHQYAEFESDFDHFWREINQISDAKFDALLAAADLSVASDRSSP
jgi:acyl carrier protein phosphodiesterase